MQPILTATSIHSDSSLSEFPQTQQCEEAYPGTPESIWPMPSSITDAEQQHGGHKHLRVVIPCGTGSTHSASAYATSPGAATAGTCSGGSTPSTSSGSMCFFGAAQQPARTLKLPTSPLFGIGGGNCPTARRLLDYNDCQNDVSSWLDQQITMRESAKASSAHGFSVAESFVGAPCSLLAGLQQAEGRPRGDLGGCAADPLPPPAFQLLGLL